MDSDSSEGSAPKGRVLNKNKDSGVTVEPVLMADPILDGKPVIDGKPINMAESQHVHEATAPALVETPRTVPVLGDRLDYKPIPRASPDSKEPKIISKVGTDGSLVNAQFVSDFKVENPGWQTLGTPEELAEKLSLVGYQCYHYLAVQLALLFATPSVKARSLLLEGPSGCGKSFMAKSLAKIAGAELMCLSCYRGMPTQNLIETPSTLAMVNAMIGKKGKTVEVNDMMNLGILSRAFLLSQKQPVLLLVDELDKPDSSIDTFFLGPIQDARIWLESRPPIDANPDNLLIVFTKNWNRVIDEALLRRVHPIRMTYLDSTLERKILSPHCHAQLVANLVTVADRMRNSGGSYAFERPPAPEELLTAGHYVTRLLEWKMADFSFVGRNIWAIVAKSEHDRAVLEHMMRFHPDFIDPLVPDAKNATIDEIYARLGRIVLAGIVEDPLAAKREAAWKNMDYN